MVAAYFILQVIPQIIVLFAFAIDIYNLQFFYIYHTIFLLTIPLIFHLFVELLNIWATGVRTYYWIL